MIDQSLRISGRTVLLIVNQAWVAWKFRAGLMDHLRSAGWKVVVVTDMRVHGDRMAPHCDEAIHVPVAASRLDPFADMRTYLGYRRAIRRVRPVAALTFTIKPNIYGSLACHDAGIPVINNVTGLGSVQRAGRVVGAIVQRLYRAAFKRSSWIFFQNRDDADRMLTANLVPAGRWSLLPGSGVDTALYSPQPRQRRSSAGAVHFCMAARLLKDKGVVEYVEAARHVRRTYPQARFDMWGILDVADPRCVSRAEIDAWQAEGIIAYHGEALDARMAFADADVVVLPSYYPEGVPRSLLEAASLALPAITTDMPGCRDAVDDGVTGLLCRARDVKALAAAMINLIERGPTVREAMGEAARERVLRQFDERIVLGRYDERLSAIWAARAPLPA